MAKKTFVLYPSLGVGHLIPMVELAKHLLRHGHDAAIAVVDAPDEDVDAAANPDVAFRLLPALPSPHPAADPVMRGIDALRLAGPALRDYLRSLPAAVDALLLDMFCADALDVAAEVGVPAYYFFASGASALAVFLNLPYYYPAVPSPSFREMGAALLRFPGAPPIRALDMVFAARDKNSARTKARLH
ncbi:hypothetical protein ACP70R_034938 [Stipagrostis hirtigluma subsp. patula]